jgi:F-type H+-transporting ATPase subunit gamma
MAGLKEIKSRLKSVLNTRKITYAMKLVSAAKLQKAQASVVKSREYSKALQAIVTNLAAEIAGSDASHPLMERREQVSNVRILVIGGSRGLCGGYNANVNRKIEATIADIKKRHPLATVEAVLVGRKPAEYFRRVNRAIFKSYEVLPEEPSKWPLEEICQALEADFLRGTVDEVRFIFTQFKSALSQTVVSEQLIPVDSKVSSTNSSEATPNTTGVTLFEPSAKQVFDAIVPRLIRSKVYQGALDSKASEYGSRMAAMDAATKNAGELANDLKLLRNRVRQASVTSELLDIIGGSEALNN